MREDASLLRARQPARLQSSRVLPQGIGCGVISPRRVGAGGREQAIERACEARDLGVGKRRRDQVCRRLESERGERLRRPGHAGRRA